MKKTLFKFPKTVMALAGATAMVFSTGFISSESAEISEAELIEMEGESLTGTTYRHTMTCGRLGGNCLPTYVCCPQQ